MEVTTNENTAGVTWFPQVYVLRGPGYPPPNYTNSFRQVKLCRKRFCYNSPGGCGNTKMVQLIVIVCISYMHILYFLLGWSRPTAWDIPDRSAYIIIIVRCLHAYMGDWFFLFALDISHDLSTYQYIGLTIVVWVCLAFKSDWIFRLLTVVTRQRPLTWLCCRDVRVHWSTIILPHNR